MDQSIYRKISYLIKKELQNDRQEKIGCCSRHYALDS